MKRMKESFTNDFLFKLEIIINDRIIYRLLHERREKQNKQEKKVI